MKYYPDELKTSVIARMLHPNNANIPELSKETGIPKDTLYMWRLKARGHRFNPSSKQHAVTGLNSEDKFNIVVETARMNQEELSAYCRSKGLYPGQIEKWRRQCAKANDAVVPKADREKARQQERQIKQLKAELRRKEKALAEAAALLVLKKKAQELWGDRQDDI
jgi:transposase